MSEKRFIIIKSIENLYALVDKERGDKEQILILSLHKEQLGVVCDLLNEQQSTINLLLDLLYQSEATVINEYSSHIGEDMDKLDKIFKEKDIKEIERFVGGCDDE